MKKVVITSEGKKIVYIPMDYYKKLHEERYRRFITAGERYEENSPSPYVLTPLHDFLSFFNLKANIHKGIECGCGNGRNISYLVRLGFSMVGIDISPTIIDQAKRLLAVQQLQADLRVADMFYLRDFGDNTFDFAIDIWTLHTVPEEIMRLKYLKEIRRVLKNNGAFFIQNSVASISQTPSETIYEYVNEWNIPTVKGIVKKRDGSIVEIEVPALYPEGASGIRTKSEYLEELSEAGFEVLKFNIQPDQTTSCLPQEQIGQQFAVIFAQRRD